MKLKKVEGKEKNRAEISNKFTTSENLDAEVDINRAWETIRENIKISAKEGLLSRLIPYIDEIIGDHQCGFLRNRSSTDQIFCIPQILKKKWEYNETVHQLFVDFKKANESVWREVLYNILAEFGVPMELVRLIKIYLNETYSEVCRVIYLSENFPI
jgi:hypothetical protein